MLTTGRLLCEFPSCSHNPEWKPRLSPCPRQALQAGAFSLFLVCGECDDLKQRYLALQIKTAFTMLRGIFFQRISVQPHYSLTVVS